MQINIACTSLFCVWFCIQNNKLVKIPSGAFENLSNLWELCLQNNVLNNDGMDNETFGCIQILILTLHLCVVPCVIHYPLRYSSTKLYCHIKSSHSSLALIVQATIVLYCVRIVLYFQ